MIYKKHQQFDNEEMLAISVTTDDMTPEIGNGISPTTHTFGSSSAASKSQSGERVID